MEAMRLFDWRESKDIAGTFWNAEVPDKTMHGSLAIRAGAFPEITIISTFEMTRHDVGDVIFGVTTDGDISLIRMIYFSQSYSGGAKYSQRIFKYKCGFCFILIGKHKKDLTFAKTIAVRFTNTHDISRRVKIDQGEEKNECVAVVEHEGNVIRIFAGTEEYTSYPSDDYQFRLVRSCARVVLSLSAPVEIEPLETLWSELELFFGIMSGSRSDVVRGAVLDRHELLEGIRLDFPIIGYCRADSKNGCTIGSLLSDLAQSGCLSGVLATWLAKCHELRTSANLLLDTLSESLSAESKLGAAAQAIEAYHRVSGLKQIFVSEQRYGEIESALREAMAKAVTGDDEKPLKESMKKRIEFGNEVSLRYRTKQLMIGIKDIWNINSKKINEIVTDSVGVRNSLVHRIPNSPNVGIVGIKKAIGYFQLVTHVALLQAIGVPNDLIGQKLLMQPHYQKWLPIAGLSG